MHKKDTMIEEIHQIRKKMWDESNHDSHSLIENIKKEAKEFIEECRDKNVVSKGGSNKKPKKNKILK